MINKESKAKLVREIPQREGSPWYFRSYELECIDCGVHYTSGRYDSRTSPYCHKCQKVHDREKAKDRVKRKKQADINEVLDKINADIKAKIVKKPWLDFEDREFILSTKYNLLAS